MKKPFIFLILFVYVFSFVSSASVNALVFPRLEYIIEHRYVYSSSDYDKCRDAYKQAISEGYFGCTIKKYKKYADWYFEQHKDKLKENPTICDVRCKSKSSSSSHTTSQNNCESYTKKICRNNDVYLKIYKSDCSKSYKKLQDCEYGCRDGKCIEPVSPRWKIKEVKVIDTDGVIRPNDLIKIRVTFENEGGEGSIYAEAGLYAPTYVNAEKLSMTFQPVAQCNKDEHFVSAVKIKSDGKDIGTYDFIVVVPNEFTKFSKNSKYAALTNFGSDMYVVVGLYHACGKGYVTYVKKKIHVKIDDSLLGTGYVNNAINQIADKDNEERDETRNKETEKVDVEVDQIPVQFENVKLSYDEEKNKIVIKGNVKINVFGSYLIGAYIDPTYYEPLTIFGRNICNGIVGNMISVSGKYSDDFVFNLDVPEKSGKYKIVLVVANDCSSSENYKELDRLEYYLKVDLKREGNVEYGTISLEPMTQSARAESIIFPLILLSGVSFGGLILLRRMRVI